MPIDERELAHITGLDSSVILDDRECAGCGYNLKGLKAGGRCPECGRPIKRRQPGNRWDDELVKSPLAWLQLFAAGATMLLISEIAAWIFGIASAVLEFSEEADALFALANAMLWTGAIWLTTRPRPVTAGSSIRPSREWRWLRIAGRSVQVFLLVSAGVDLAEASWGVLPTALDWLGVGAHWCWTVGMGATCVLLSNYVDWAGDSAMVGKWRVLAYLYPISAVLSLFPLISTLVAGTPATAFSLPWFFAFPIIGVIAFLQLYCLWKLNGLALWAVKNRKEADAREERLRAKARAELAMQQARKK